MRKSMLHCAPYYQRVGCTLPVESMTEVTVVRGRYVCTCASRAKLRGGAVHTNTALGLLYKALYRDTPREDKYYLDNTHA